MTARTTVRSRLDSGGGGVGSAEGRRPGGRRGQAEAHRRPLARLALDRQLAAVGDHQVLDDGEAETGTAQLTRASLVYPVEALGDAGQVGPGDTDTGVGHLD